MHRLVEGRKLILGGVEIPYPRGLDGHSDADVVLHALSDALLGAAALGDIGRHFPNSDPRYKGISSQILLKQVAGILTQHRYTVVNVDITIILEQPKIAPFADAMRQNIAGILGIPTEAVSIKATTHEGLGFIGMQQGAAAHAVAMVLQE